MTSLSFPEPGGARSADSLEYSLARYEQMVQALKFPADQPDRWADWTSCARQKLAELIGLPQALDKPRPSLDLQQGEKFTGPGYVRRLVRFETRPGLEAVGWLLMPEQISGPKPAVICLPGHGRGADEIVGINENGHDDEKVGSYQNNFAIQCVRQGYVTLALEMIGFGHRRDAAARRNGPGASSCMPAAGAALLLGESMVGWRVWDTIRAIDLLSGLSEVDSSRIGLIGISGGGTVASYAAALDERVGCTLLSGSFCTFRDSIFSVAHCIDNYVPGILKWFEVADIAAMITPRLLFCESGGHDDLFPEPGVRQAFNEAQKAYNAMNVAKNIELEIFNAGHIFDGLKAFDWMQQHWK